MYRDSQALKSENELSSFKIWLMAVRPKTLSISCAPIFVGTILSLGETQKINWFLAFSAFISAILIQMGINIINDALDFKRGADTQERLGPPRVTQTKLLSYHQVLRGGGLCFAAALLCGMPLMIAGGWPLATALLVSIIFGYLYTGGPAPLAYYGLGELFVMIFFGYVITCSAYYVQTGMVNTYCLLAATQIGLLAIVPIVINNTRDIESDRKANKRTLSVRFGLAFSRCEIAFFSASAYLIGFAWIVKGYPKMALLPFLAFPLVFENIRAVWQKEPSKEYNQYLARSAQSQLFFCLLLALGYLLST